MKTFILSLFFVIGVAISVNAQALTEDQKIESLITYVEKLDATFIRNGKEYKPEQAGKLMREKLKRKRDKVKTAKDFIVECASISSSSGEAYKVRLKDGKTITTQELLTKELVRLESKGK